MIKIGITGVIGSGKSTIAAILKQFGVPVIDADEISRSITKPGTDVFYQIVDKFGKGVLTNDGELDRKKIADIVFSDPKKRKTLEDIIHPAVKAERNRLIKLFDEKGCSIVALDVPLLFEAGMDKEVDIIILAYADEDTLYERVKKRDNMSFEEFEKRLKSQLPLSVKKAKSHYVIDTRKSIDELKIEIANIINKISSEKTK